MQGSQFCTALRCSYECVSAGPHSTEHWSQHMHCCRASQLGHLSLKWEGSIVTYFGILSIPFFCVICAKIIILPSNKKQVMHQLLYKHLKYFSALVFFALEVTYFIGNPGHVWHNCNCSSSENKAEWSPKDEFLFSKVFATVFYSVLLYKTTPGKLIVYTGRWVNCGKGQAEG